MLPAAKLRFPANSSLWTKPILRAMRRITLTTATSRHGLRAIPPERSHPGTCVRIRLPGSSPCATFSAVFSRATSAL